MFNNTSPQHFSNNQLVQQTNITNQYDFYPMIHLLMLSYIFHILIHFTSEV